MVEYKLNGNKCKTCSGSNHSQVFQKLYHQYKNLYFNYILKLINNYETAEDLLQESFLKIAKSLHTLKDKSKFRSWGFQIVSNTCYDWHKKIRKDTVIYTENIEKIEDKKIIIKEDTPVKNITEIINEILNTFEYEEKEIFILKQYEKMNYREIAKTLGLSKRTVRRRMKSALVKLIVELERLKFVRGNYFNLKG